MITYALMLNPVPHGWAVSLTNGDELARFVGPAARWRALRYLTQTANGHSSASGGHSSGSGR
jgi:hypothetical protein